MASNQQLSQGAWTVASDMDAICTNVCTASTITQAKDALMDALVSNPTLSSEDSFRFGIQFVRVSEELFGDHLDINISNLADALEPHIKLSNLKGLICPRYVRHGADPYDITGIQRFSDLEHLSLKNLQQFQSSLNDIDLLQYLTNLRVLDLSNNYLEEIVPLQYLTNLHTLNLSNNRVEIITPLQHLTYLQTLNLSQNQNLEEIVPLQYLTNLHTLNLSKNSVEIITPLQHLTNLQTLNLSQNQNIEDISAIRKLMNLQALQLLGCDKIGDFSPILCPGLTSLRCLELKYPDQTTEAGIGTQIQKVDVSELLKSWVPDTNLVIDLSELRFRIKMSEFALLCCSARSNNRIMRREMSHAPYDTTCVDCGMNMSTSDAYEIRYATYIHTDTYTTRNDSHSGSLCSRCFACYPESSLFIGDDSWLRFDSMDLTSARLAVLIMNVITSNILTGAWRQINDSLYPLHDQLCQLQIVNLGDNQISDCSPLCICVNMHTLSLDRNNLTDISSLSNLKTLHTLDLWRNVSVIVLVCISFFSCTYLN